MFNKNFWPLHNTLPEETYQSQDTLAFAHLSYLTKQSSIIGAIFRSPLCCHLIIRLHATFNYGDIVNLMIHGGLVIRFF